MAGPSDATESDKRMTTVGIFGAGVSGILMGMRLRQAGFDDFVLYEKLPDVGGTWLRNTYPGLHCDIPSHLYSYSFEPNPDWSLTYAGQAEIQAYLRRCAEKYDLIGRIRFGTSVEAARYDEVEDVWNLELADGSVATHRVLVSATGGLTEPSLPRIEGLDRFAGPSWHAGHWRHDVSLAGKRVAVVGSAASAVQVVPEVAKEAAEVHVFCRTPNWVTPRNNTPYSEEERDGLRDPQRWRRLWRRQYRESMLWYGAFRRRPEAIQQLRETCLANLRSAISDPELVAALTPDFDPGCNRILVSDDYYPALAQPHVHLVRHGVTGLTETAVVAADGSETEVDIVIYCTGYRLGGRADGRPAVEVFGRGGITMRQALGREPEAYRGVAVPGFPNYFTICGVNGTVAYGPVFLSAELETEFIAGWIGRIADEPLRSVEVRADVAHSWSEAIQAELSTMSWTGNCPNFYRDRSGRIVSFFPGTIGRMRRELRAVGDEDFILTPA